MGRKAVHIPGERVILNIDPGSPVPPYEQIREQITAMVSSGVLPVDSRLPTIRQLARDLGLATGTVARAYRELEAEGVISTRGRQGTFVQTLKPRSTVDTTALLEAAARDLATRARQLGADEERTLTVLRGVFGAEA